MMQEIFTKTRGDLFKDLLAIQQLTVAYHRPDNIKDLLIPSKLKYSNRQKNPQIIFLVTCYSEKFIIFVQIIIKLTLLISYKIILPHKWY